MPLLASPAALRGLPPKKRRLLVWGREQSAIGGHKVSGLQALVAAHQTTPAGAQQHAPHSSF